MKNGKVIQGIYVLFILLVNPYSSFAAWSDDISFHFPSDSSGIYKISDKDSQLAYIRQFKRDYGLSERSILKAGEDRRIFESKFEENLVDKLLFDSIILETVRYIRIKSSIVDDHIVQFTASNQKNEQFFCVYSILFMEESTKDNTFQSLSCYDQSGVERFSSVYVTVKNQEPKKKVLVNDLFEKKMDADKSAVDPATVEEILTKKNSLINIEKEVSTFFSSVLGHPIIKSSAVFVSNKMSYVELEGSEQQVISCYYVTEKFILACVEKNSPDKFFYLGVYSSLKHIFFEIVNNVGL